MEDQENDKVIAAFEKNSKEEVRVSVGSFRGREIINVRVYYRTPSGEWLPGKQGIAIAVERYRHLADAVLQLGEWLEANKKL